VRAVAESSGGIAVQPERLRAESGKPMRGKGALAGESGREVDDGECGEVAGTGGAPGAGTAVNLQRKHRRTHEPNPYHCAPPGRRFLTSDPIAVTTWREPCGIATIS
jgi:hypothetical protein